MDREKEENKMLADYNSRLRGGIAAAAYPIEVSRKEWEEQWKWICFRFSFSMSTVEDIGRRQALTTFPTVSREFTLSFA